MRKLAAAYRVVIAVIVAVLLDDPSYAQTSPSIYQNPGVNFALIRRVGLVGFLAGREGVQDPFAAEKATAHLSNALRARGVTLVDYETIARRIVAETGIDLSRSLAPEERDRVALWELPKHMDALFIGYLSHWGTIQTEGRRPYPVYGWNQGSWGVIAWVPVPATRDATVIGASVALVQLPGNGQRWVLAWQYSQVRIDSGGPFIWNRPPTPDELAQRFFQEVAKAVPLAP